MSGSTIFFHVISQTARFSKNQLLNTKCVFWFSLRLSETFFIRTNKNREILSQMHTSSCRVPLLFLSRFNETWIFSTISPNPSNMKFHENPTTEAQFSTKYLRISDPETRCEPANTMKQELTTTLHYPTLHITLQYTLHYTTLPHTPPINNTTLPYPTLHYTTPQYPTLHYTKLPYPKLHNPTLQYPTLHYTPLHYTTPHRTPMWT